LRPETKPSYISGYIAIHSQFTIPNLPLNNMSLPDKFWQGIEQFNQQEFYACHDPLEALWIEASEP